MLKKNTARTISDIFNGFLTMILTPVIAILFSPLEIFNKLIYIAIYTLIPTLTYLILKYKGKISDSDMTDRKQRPPFFITISILYGIMYLLLRSKNIETLTNISLNLFTVTSVITFITFFWKISGHMTYSTILFTTLNYLFTSPYLLAIYIFSPLIAWSRIVLKKHTLTQVSFGMLITLSISILIYWVF